MEEGGGVGVDGAVVGWVVAFYVDDEDDETHFLWGGRGSGECRGCRWMVI